MSDEQLLLGDRVSLGKNKGTVKEIGENGRRALVQWDGMEKTEWQNVKPLILELRPPSQGFCSYCLVTLKNLEPIITNPRSGAVIHMRCAEIISETLIKAKTIQTETKV